MTDVIDTKTTRCRSCGDPVVFLPMPGSGKLNPVNADTVSPGDTEFVWGKHVSHFSTCNESERWRRR